MQTTDIAIPGAPPDSPLLKDTETCQQRTLLKDVLDVLAAVGIKSWLDQGTLLGLLRDGAIIPWDTDIDLGMWFVDLKGKRRRLRRLAAERNIYLSIGINKLRFMSLDSRQRLLPVHVAFYRRYDGKAIQLFSRPAEALVSRCFERWVLRPTVGVFGYYLLSCSRAAFRIASIHYVAARRGASRVACMTCALVLASAADVVLRVTKSLRRRFVVVETDASVFDSLAEVQFLGLSVYIPKESQRYIEAKYGAGWREPRREWTHWRDDGHIVGRSR